MRRARAPCRPGGCDAMALAAGHGPLRGPVGCRGRSRSSSMHAPAPGDPLRSSAMPMADARHTQQHALRMVTAGPGLPARENATAMGAQARDLRFSDGANDSYLERQIIVFVRGGVDWPALSPVEPAPAPTTGARTTLGRCSMSRCKTRVRLQQQLRGKPRQVVGRGGGGRARPDQARTKGLQMLPPAVLAWGSSWGWRQLQAEGLLARLAVGACNVLHTQAGTVNGRAGGSGRTRHAHSRKNSTEHCLHADDARPVMHQKPPHVCA